jgi:hypothetical protein
MLALVGGAAFGAPTTWSSAQLQSTEVTSMNHHHHLHHGRKSHRRSRRSHFFKHWNGVVQPSGKPPTTSPPPPPPALPPDTPPSPPPAAASESEAFYDFILDGSGNVSIPTMFGRSPTRGCECRSAGSKLNPKHVSRHARRTRGMSDDVNNVPFCLSTYDPGDSDTNTMWDWHYNHLVEGACNIDVEHDKRPFDFRNLQTVRRCLTPDRKSPDHPTKTMFVLGDCHVGVLLPALSLATRGIYQIRHMQANTVGIFPHIQNTANLNQKRFMDFYTEILAVIRHSIQRDDIVVITQFAGNWQDEAGGYRATMDGMSMVGGMPEAMSEGAGAVPTALNETGEVHAARSIIDRYLGPLPLELMERDLLEGIVEPAHGRLYVFGEWPYFKELNGFGVWGDDKMQVGLQGDVTNQAYLQRSIEPMIRRHPSLYYHSLLPLFCDYGTVLDNNWTETPKGACGWQIPGTNIQAYSNENHLNTHGSIYLWPFLCDIFHGQSAAPV